MSCWNVGQKLLATGPRIFPYLQVLIVTVLLSGQKLSTKIILLMNEPFL